MLNADRGMVELPITGDVFRRFGRGGAENGGEDFDPLRDAESGALCGARKHEIARVLTG
jgi:hypothetical protein